VKSLAALLPTAADVLKLSPRELAGYLLESINADPAVTRYHPKNVCTAIGNEYDGILRTSVVQAVDEALRLMEREALVGKDYLDAIDATWFVVTDKGRLIRQHEVMAEPKILLDTKQPLVFVSCGQVLDKEIALGNAIAKAIDEGTEFTAYFAQQVHSLAGLNETILDACANAVAFVFVMHPRGSVNVSKGTLIRGSVWIEQELAIAAFLQRNGRHLPVAAYIHEDVAREGLRTLLQLNETAFVSEEEVIEHFRNSISSGEFSRRIDAAQVARHAAAAPRLELKPLLAAKAFVVTREEGISLNLHPRSDAPRLVIELRNAGLGPAEDVQVKMQGGSYPDFVDKIDPIGPGETLLRPYRIEVSAQGQVHTQSAPSEILVDYSGSGWTGATIALQRHDTFPPTYRTAH